MGRLSSSCFCILLLLFLFNPTHRVCFRLWQRTHAGEKNVFV
jgi:hypothetical protein